MRLTVLNVAYPLSAVSSTAVGGAEQIVAHLDRALVRAGHRSIVIGCEGSRVDGELVAVPQVRGHFDEVAIQAARSRHRDTIAAVLAREPVDIVHMHGFDYHSYLPAPGPPVLVTLHCPIDWYDRDALATRRPHTWFNCVSQTQQAEIGTNPAALLPAIENGVPSNEPVVMPRKRKFALMLSRISRDKGIHIGIEAAKAARIPLLIAGKVFPYAEHLRYFDEEVMPRLDERRCFLGSPDLATKRRLLSTARCLLAPSLEPETSSLVAREALAAGTPVVAFPVGALSDIIEHGRTGFLVRDVDAMAAAIEAAAHIHPEDCRRVARERFPLSRMTQTYIATYEDLVERAGRDLQRGAA